MQEKENENRSADAKSSPSVERQPYEPPELVEYGSVTKLTRGTLSVANDGPGGGRRMLMCL